MDSQNKQMKDTFDQLIQFLAKREKIINERHQQVVDELQNMKEAVALVVQHQIESSKQINILKQK
jgi:hypothetical protein